MNHKIEASDHIDAIKAYYEKYNIETIDQKIKSNELEYETLFRKEYGSVNKSNEKIQKKVSKHFVTFDSATKLDLMKLHSLFHRIVVGTRFKETSIGNKRLGRKVYYCDLFKCFLVLDKLNIKLPKNGLSQKACEYGLIDVLKKHGKIPPSIIHKSYFNTKERIVIWKSNESAFLHIIAFLKKYPP